LSATQPGAGAVRFGVNLNNREPLIAPDYTVADLLDLSERVEELGFSSVWVGDSLFSKPRYEPISLLSAISQRTEKVQLGTACLVAATRNPLYLAMEWATLDVISGGRTILGPCMGNPEKGVQREFEALGLPFGKRGSVLEEVLEVVRTLWTEGKVTFHGEYYEYDGVAFHSGTEMAPLGPLQEPPPIWVVSNPRLVDDSSDERMVRRMKRACRRIIRYGDGWMTCCRAQHPEELTEQIGYLEEAAAELDRDFAGYTVAYQVTMNIADSEEEAKTAFGDYISKYYPELSQAMDLSNWGPVGTPEQIAEWLREFANRGVGHFICRFGDLDQFAQVDRLAEQVLPIFEHEIAR
jgi:alkanesulfonate monooxygenase SsuD/methylene tetrahydromethanopterin reductase-like flavin-dependent oxidoreductase (luciferase family)